MSIILLLGACLINQSLYEQRKAELADTSSTSRDADGDGYVADTAGGTDCDDTDPKVHPGATDTWYDGIDSDCAANDDYDADGDGDDADAYGGSDCDDTDPTRSGLASEGWRDLGVDNDCDGVVEEALVASAAQSGITVQGPSSTGMLGYALDFMDDIDDDGVPDAWAVAPNDSAAGAYAGAAYLVSGARLLGGSNVDLTDTDRLVEGQNTGAFLGLGRRSEIGRRTVRGTWRLELPGPSTQMESSLCIGRRT